MNIKKVDDKPMVIHTKEKTKIHVKAQPETKIKGRNVLVVDKSPKIAGAEKEEQTDKRKSALKIRPEQIKKDGQTQKGRASAKEQVRKSVQKEAGVYAKYKKTKADREKAIGKKTGTVKTAASVGAMTALERMEGGNLKITEIVLVTENWKGTEAKEGNCQIGIEWGHGVYLGSTPSRQNRP